MQFVDKVMIAHDLIWQVPGTFEIKDKHSRCLAANEITTKLFGYQHLDDVLGITDYDLKCDAARFAPDFIREDKEVFRTGKPLSILYIMQYADGKTYALHAIKKLIQLNHEQETAIMAQGIFLSKSLPDLDLHLLKFDRQFLKKNTPHLGCYYIGGLLNNEIFLSKKQAECLFYLLRGKTAKEIANRLFLSTRTIESHIENIKMNFNCQTKSELIEKAIELGYLYYLPDNLFYLD